MAFSRRKWLRYVSYVIRRRLLVSTLLVKYLDEDTSTLFYLTLERKIRRFLDENNDVNVRYVT